MAFYFDSINALKSWEPNPIKFFTTTQMVNYEQKIQDSCLDMTMPAQLIAEEGESLNPDSDYMAYIAQTHMFNMVKYLNDCKYYLGDIILGIKAILKEIINQEVDEDYYLNTIKIYEDLIYNITGDENINIYQLLDEAIKRDNKRLIYYLFFDEDLTVRDRIEEYTK